MSNRPKRRPGCAAIGCFSLFIALGLLISTLALFRPLWRAVASQWWRPTSCTIVSCDLAVGADSGPNDAGLLISYEYEVSEQHFSSTRYSFSGYSAGLSRSTVRRIVDLLPAGSRSTCYVNPSDPSDAVLERRVSGDYFYGLIPLALTVGALVGMVWLLRRGRFRTTSGDVERIS